MTFRGCFLATMVFFSMASAASHAYADGWDLRFSNDGLSVFTKHIEGAQIKSFKAEMVVDSPLDTVLARIEDVQHYPDWFHLCRSYQVINGSVDEGKYVGYYVVEAPWPLKDRDVYVENKISRDPVTGSVSILSFAVPDYGPKVDEFTRVPEVYGKWTIKPLNPGKTYIEFIGHGHPGGIIPVWIANLVVTDVPKKSFQNLRALLK